MEKQEPSAIWKCIRDFYHDNRVIINNVEVERYGSLKQGCAFACLLSNIMLYDIDKEMEKFDVIYYRYSDDIICIGKEYQQAKARYEEMLREYGLTINPKKTEYINSNNWFTFLGFKIRGKDITISKKSLKSIEHKIKTETISKSRKNKRALTENEIRKAIDNIQYYLYYGCKDKPFGMATYLFNGKNKQNENC